MMGIHVANSDNNKIYFVVDPSGPRETGAIVYPTGQMTAFDFWGWVSANPEIQKLEENEFQEQLWNEPLPQDEELWDAIFFSRTTPLSGIIDQQLLVNIGGGGKPKPGSSKGDLAKQIMERSASGGGR